MLRFAAAPILAVSVLAAPAAARAQTLADALGAGEVFADARLRAETIEDDGFAESAQALTARTRAGFVTREFRRLTALIEAEATAAIAGDFAPPAALGGAGFPYPSVGAAGNVELNRIQLSYDHGGAYAALGRQVLTFDDERYVGEEDWRQDDRNFDALYGALDIAPGLELSYAYVWRMNGTYGRRDDLTSDSHLVHLRWTRSNALRLSGFAYLIDLPGAPELSSATYGARATGALPAGPAVLDYELAWARQGDHGAAAGGFALDDIVAGATLAYGPVSAGARWQRLDGDGVRGVTYPFASRHGQRGWTDLFEHGPATGMEVWTLRAEANLSYLPVFASLRGLTAELAWHDFAGRRGGGAAGGRLGSEWNLGARLVLDRRWSAGFGFADFRGAPNGPPDRRQAWVELMWRR